MNIHKLVDSLEMKTGIPHVSKSLGASVIIRWSSPYGGLVASSLKGVSAYIVVYIYIYVSYL